MSPKYTAHPSGFELTANMQMLADAGITASSMSHRRCFTDVCKPNKAVALLSLQN